MKRLFDMKALVSLTLTVMFIGGFVFTIGFGTCLYIARQEVSNEANNKVQREIEYIQAFIDGQLLRIEDAGYSLASRNFGNTKRESNGNAYVAIDPKTFVRPSEEECYKIMEEFMDANPIVCGIAFCFEPYVYPDIECKYNFTPYVTRLSGKYMRRNLGDYVDSYKNEWYYGAAKSNKGYWTNPFRESTCNRVISCYSIPVHGYGGRLVGVLAIDIDTEAFGKKCSEISPYPNTVISLADRNFRFIFHPDTANIMKNVAEVDKYKDFKSDDSMRIKMQKGEAGHYSVNKGGENEILFFFAPIERAGWTIAIECPENEVYGGVDRMKRDTTFIAIFCIIIMVICFMYIFNRIKAVTLSKASIESELKIASGIQMGMIPKLYPAFPDRKEIDVYGFLKPAKDVGGDMYDYFIRDEKLFFAIGDVSGKGIPASLFMAVIRSLFRNITLHTSNPADIATGLNKALSDGNVHNMFCTMFIGVLDLKNGHLDYCNAGHNAPIIRRITEKDGEKNLDVHFAKVKTNLAVGVFEEFIYEKEEDTLLPGEAIFLYTDGVSEAEDIHHVLFGDDATLNTLKDARVHHAQSAKDFVEFMYQAVQKHASKAEQSDDITMVVIEYKGTE